MSRVTPLNQTGSFHALGPNPAMTPVQAVLLEAALTFNLVFIAMSCTDYKSRPVAVAGLPIGFTIGLGIMAAVSMRQALTKPITRFHCLI